MAERLTLEPEVRAILCHIDNGDNFLLSGGAWSGKTYSLVQVIKQVIEENPTFKVACVTYTNAAVKEIEERVNHKNLTVSTIHDFLWDNIKHFQKELKTSLILLMNDETSKIKSPNDDVVPDNYFDLIDTGIQYKEYLKIKDGIISHDEVLELANHLYKNYPKICDILKDKFKFIFIDEYQDSSKHVIEIFLTHLKQSERRNIIGLFGDAMQSIYEDWIGNLDDYKGDEEGKVREIKKEQNRRSPQLVIDLANKLRSDWIIQTVSNDIHAPNMHNGTIKIWNIKFYYSNNADIEAVKLQTGWDFTNTKETKILNLTHNLIAPSAGFSDLMEIYDKDPIIGLKNEIVKKLKEPSSTTIINESDTFDQVVDRMQLKNRSRILKKDVILSSISASELYNNLKDKPFLEVKKIYLTKDSLIDDKKQDVDTENKKGSKRDDLIKHLFKIQNIISFYTKSQYNEFIRTTEYKISSIADKNILKQKIIDLSVNIQDQTIEDIINKSDLYGICKKDDKLNKFILKNEYIYNRVKSIKFSEFQNLYSYLEGYTPFSTQHKTKGSEFENVLIILDNGGWNNYNFSWLFENNNSASVGERTKKIFYVCCTRAKENLAVYFHNPSQTAINKALGWFGTDNVIQL